MDIKIGMIINRRDFLKWLAATGGGFALMQFLGSCTSQVPTDTSPYITQSTEAVLPYPIATPQEDLIAALRDLPLDQFLDEAYRLWMLRDPERVTLNGLSGFFGVRNDQLTNVSATYIQETHQIQKAILNLLNQYDATSFTPEQSLNARLYRWFLEDHQAGQEFMYSDYLVFPFLNSLTWYMNYLFTEIQPIANEQDLQDTISRLNQVDEKMEQVLEGLILRKENGVILPSLLMQNAVSDIRQYTQTGNAHPYYQALSSRIGANQNLDNDEKAVWRSQILEVINESVAPGFNQILNFFIDSSFNAPKDIGVWRFPNGLEYYDYLLRHYTSTELTAAEIHQMGLDHVERIKKEMRSEFSVMGYSISESIQEIVERLGDDYGYIQGSAAEDYIQVIIHQAVSMLDLAFDFSLNQEISVIGGEQGNYLSPAPRDGSRPPIFYAYTNNNQPRYRLKSIIYHEAVPGHGFQDDVSAQLQLPLHRFAFDHNAFLEGWALYAERLMWEHGAYEDDPAGNIGRLELELLRAVRCVLDTGIHALGWTYEQSSEYMLDSMGIPAEYEILRYIMLPGQAPSYYVGYLKILDLRQKAMSKLGLDFDLKEFHHVILGSSQVPLSIMEELVDEYLANG